MACPRNPFFDCNLVLYNPRTILCNLSSCRKARHSCVRVQVSDKGGYKNGRHLRTYIRIIELNDCLVKERGQRAGRLSRLA